MTHAFGRRTAIVAAGAATATLMGARMALADEQVANHIAKAFSPSRETSSIALWGSSSMEGGLGAEHTPRPVYVHEELANSFNLIPVFNLAYGAQHSNHTTLLRGVDTPRVTFPKGYTGGAKVQVKVDTRALPLWTFRCHGSLSNGGSGTLTGSSDSRTWHFEPDPGREVKSGDFHSSWFEKTADARHVVWTGKNNILHSHRVLRDTSRVVQAARRPQEDVIVMGQWVTLNDLQTPKKITSMAEVNEAQLAEYGARFLDVQSVLTSEQWLTTEPLWELNLLDNPKTQAELKKGIVPTPLRGSDGVHLSGWGNLLVFWALVEKMKELQWL